MFGWFRKRQKSDGGASALPSDPALREGVNTLVAFVRADPAADDDAIARRLIEQGLSERQATKLIQFVPIAFTRFLYRAKGVRFAPNYVVLGPDAQPTAQRPIADEPAYREAWRHCAQAAKDGEGDAYFIPIAARSGGYRALQDLIQRGSNLADVITSPPMMRE